MCWGKYLLWWFFPLGTVTFNLLKCSLFQNFDFFLQVLNSILLPPFFFFSYTEFLVINKGEMAALFTRV